MRIICLGLAQLVFWGTSFYSIGVFGPHFESDLQFSKELVYGGFSAALVTMGLASPLAGKLVRRFGGFRIMAAGAVLAAVSSAALAMVESVAAYYVVWILRGIAMRLTLYDAAFATLAQIDDTDAPRAMSQITLLGGFASSVFWPLGQALVSGLGAERALLTYAVLPLICILLLLPLRRPSAADGPAASPVRRNGEQDGGSPPAAIALFVVTVTTTVFLLAGLSSQLIPIFIALGNEPKTAAWIAALMGVGQVTSRVLKVGFGGSIDAPKLNLISAVLISIGFSCGLAAEFIWIAGLTFAFLYGAGHGLTAIVRGTLPLLLFDRESYAERVGRLIVPGFFVSAAAPAVYAYLMSEFGERGPLAASWLLGCVILVAAVLLRRILRAAAPS